MTRQTDYGIVLLTCMAGRPAHPVYTARDLAGEAHLSLPMVSKILKLLARKGLLISHRGVKGGYSLADQPDRISVDRIITALEGPVAMTTCSTEVPGRCAYEPWCPNRSNWQLINRAVRTALGQITLSEMAHPLQAKLLTLGGIGQVHGAGA
jgi:FeS assembly SUF system regulator